MTSEDFVIRLVGTPNNLDIPVKEVKQDENGVHFDGGLVH